MARTKNLFHVNAQWRNRQAHERFFDVADIMAPLEFEHKYERSALVPMDKVRVIADQEDDGNLYLEYPGLKQPAELNHWSFTGLAKQLDISTSDIRQFPARYIAPILQYRLEHAAGIAATPDDIEDEDMDAAIADVFDDHVAKGAADSQSRQMNVLVALDHTTKKPFIRSITSADYGRYSNLQLGRDAMLAVERGWRTPRAMPANNNPFNDVSRYGENHPQADRIATAADEMQCSLIKAGMKIGPAGVYLGDRNMFIFLASDLEVLPGHFRFVTLENSEVGENRALKATFGLMNYVCMNHILWGCTNYHEVTKKHRKGSVGLFRDEFEKSLELTTRSDGVPLALYDLAKNTELAKDKEGIVKALYGRRSPVISQRVAEKAYDTAVSNPGDADGASPTSYWGVVQGLTRLSQTFKHADTRWEIDKFAGSLLNELKIEDAAKTVNVPATIETEMVVSVTKNEDVKPSRKAKATK